MLKIENQLSKPPNNECIKFSSSFQVQASFGKAASSRLFHACDGYLRSACGLTQAIERSEAQKIDYFERRAVDYPELNLLFGLGLIFTLVVNIGLRVLLTKVSLSVWLSVISWVALLLSMLSALYVEILFLRLMAPSFNWQIVFGLLLIGGVGALVTANMYRKEISSRIAGLVLGAQILSGLASVVIAFILYRSLVPV